MAARSFPTWIITQNPGMVPNRKGPFHDDKHVEQMLRDAYRSNPDIICIVIDNPLETAWYPQHGYEWLDMFGDRRRRHPRKDRVATPPPAPNLRVDVDRLAASILTAACELDGPADPAGDDTISITMKDLEAVVHRHVTVALEETR